MANKFQFKRTTVAGRTANTTNVANSAFIDKGELAINLTDRKVFSSDAANTIFEVGSNLTSLAVTTIVANGSPGSGGLVLTSNGTGVYWTSPGSANAATMNTYTFTVTSNTSVFTGPDDTSNTFVYTPGLESVFINGSRQVLGVDYNTTNTTVLTLTSNALSGDIVQVTTLNVINTTGAQGATGNTGAQGVTGPQGAQGVVGAQGVASNSVTMNTYTYSITSNTTTITGADDTANTLIYTVGLESVFINGFRQISGVDYNTTNTTVITLTANVVNTDVVQVTTFKDAVVVVGAQGATGAQGVIGAQGAQGAQGTTGNTGAQGTTGNTGAQGTTGNTGAQGTTGAQGAQGTTGAQGTIGSQGAQGEIGAQGAQGSIGSPGIQGAQGATGAQGTIGPQGAQGAASAVPGPQGATGAQGAQGVIGPQGVTGAQGAQGAAATIGGSNTHVQFNDSTSFNGSSGFTFDKTSNNVTIANGISAATGTFTGELSVGTAFVANTTRIVVGSSAGLQANGGLGTAGQVLASNGTGVYWATAAAGGGGSSVTTIILANSSITAVKDTRYIIANTSLTTITLPASPTLGDSLYFTVSNGLTTNVIDRNGQNIMSAAENLTLDVSNLSLGLVYADTTLGWRII